jgi:hypothetical protein
MFLPYTVDAQMAEAFAFQEGLGLAQQIGCNNFIIQIDCAQMVETIKHEVFFSDRFSCYLRRLHYPLEWF